MLGVISHFFTDNIVKIEEIENYISIIVNMEQIKNGVKTYHKHPMKLCDRKDF